MSSSASNTFGARLNAAIDGAYDTQLRRSIQSVVLYEAKRILAQIEAQRFAQNMGQLRAFQRKHVHWELCKAVLNLTTLHPHQRVEVLWRTATSKEPLGADTAWKRAKTIEKEVKALAETISSIQNARKCTHQQAIDAYIEQQFVSLLCRCW